MLGRSNKPLLTIGLIIISGTLFCQSIKFRNIGVNQGLSHSYVISFLQDSQGLMWIGTYDGLNMYDGYSLFLYTSEADDSNAISNSCVYSILEDSKGKIWVGTEYGLNKFDKETGRFKWFLNESNNPRSLPHNHIRDIKEDNSGNIWLATYGGGFSKFNPVTEEFTAYTVSVDSSGLLNNNVNTLLFASDGLLWVGTENGGISVFNPETESFVNQFYAGKADNSINNNTINSIYEDREGNFWIGTWNGGLNKFNIQTKEWTYYINIPGNQKSLPVNTIRDIAYDSESHLWLATYGGGLCRFNTQTGETEKLYFNFNHQVSIAQQNLWCLFKDNRSNLWIGSYGDGIYLFSHLKTTFPYHFIESSENGIDEILGITSVVEDKKGVIWIGTFTGELYNYNRSDNTITQFASGNYTFQNTISSLYSDSEDRLWIGTNYGLYRISENRSEIIYYEPGNSKDKLDNNSIISIFEDSYGDLWLGMWGVGINLIAADEIARKDPASTTFIKYAIDQNDSTTLSHHVVWSIMEDSHNNIWLGTSDYLNKFDKKTQSFQRFKDIKTVASIIEDNAGNLWAASLSTGLYKFDKNGKILEVITEYIGTQKAVIENLLQDKNGNLWMSSRNNILKYNPQSKKFNVYTSEYGLQDDNFLVNSSAGLQSGELIFAGMKGFNIFSPEKIPTEKEIPEIIITDFKLFNKSVISGSNGIAEGIVYKPIYSTDTVRLNYRQNAFSIEFAALEYSDPQHLLYEYRLDGFDEKWTKTLASDRKATYTNLKGGVYRFKVRSMDQMRQQISKNAELVIIILPPFWQTIFFKVLVVAFVLVIILLLSQVREKQIKQRLLLTHEHSLNENLKHEQVIIQKQNELLLEEIARNEKKLATITLQRVNYYEKLKSLYNYLLDLREKKRVTNANRINKLIKSIEADLRNENISPEKFEENFNVLHNDFLGRFAKEFPKITHNDLKICAYLRMNKSNKEIAELLNISSKSFEMTRYRIRKKLDIDKDTNLNSFILRY